LIIVNLMFLAVPFLNLWVGPEFGVPVRGVVIYLGITALLQVVTTQVPLPFYQSMHLMGVPARVLILEAVTNLILSIALAHRWGIEGVALGTLLPTAFISSAILPAWLWRRLSLRPSTVIFRGLAPSLILASVLSLLHMYVTSRFAVASFPGLAACGGLSLPLAFAIFWLLFPKDDRRLLLRVIGR
jgi:O-antigen/teichoic acid export membrane protein